MKKLIYLIIILCIVIIGGLGYKNNRDQSMIFAINNYIIIFNSNKTLDGMESIYDDFLLDKDLIKYYGRSKRFDKEYDETKEYFENKINKVYKAYYDGELEEYGELFQDLTDTVITQGTDDLDSILGSGE